MQIIILSIHLLVSVCLIGLVLLQRSEGGALGIGGGGGGSLMSGRGASDALARLTSIAGALFLGISLLLTWLSGAAQTTGGSVLDFTPTQEAPATLAPAPEPTAPATEDPTQSSLEQETSLAEAILPGPRDANAAPTQQNAPTTPNTARAAPIEVTRQAANNTQRTAAPTPQRSPTTTATTRVSTGQTANQTATGTTPQRGTTAVQATPQNNGAINGVTLTDPSTTESGQNGAMEAVRRQRAGPDQ